MSSEPVAKKAKYIGDLFHSARLKVAASPEEFQYNKKRVKLLSGSEAFLRQECKAVAYYMHRDQRIQDNWAMIYAQKLALEHGIPLHVIAMISSKHPTDAGATLRTVKFSLDGLEETSKDLKQLNISFHLILAQDNNTPGNQVADLMSKINIGCLVVDFSPLHPHKNIIREIMKSSLIQGRPIYQVDAHNIVPVWITSDKQEYAARTIRNKIVGKLDEFLTEFPPVIYHPHGKSNATIHYLANKGNNNLQKEWQGLVKSLRGPKLDNTVKPVNDFKAGTISGYEALQSFIDTRIKIYNDKSNDPTVDGLSNMSPWFHIGQVSVQRAVLYVKKRASQYSKDFLEQAVVRRELADNFCHYNKSYDKVEGAADWARKTLDDHKNDKRPYLYTRKQLEMGQTHDDLWNAAQIQLRNEGKMHGFMRLYWAKKILEWTESPEVALQDAIYLNDHYSLDGNDANGFVGCMWSICGIHDRAWGERPIFGKIRYQNYEGCKRKFEILKYISRHKSIKK